MCLFPWLQKEECSIATGWVMLWEAAALLLFLCLLQSLGAKTWKPGIDVSCVQMLHWWMPGCVGLGDASSGACVACRVDELRCWGSFAVCSPQALSLSLHPWLAQTRWWRRRAATCRDNSPSLEFIPFFPSKVTSTFPTRLLVQTDRQPLERWQAARLLEPYMGPGLQLGSLASPKSCSDGSLLPAMPLHGDSPEWRAMCLQWLDVNARAQLICSCMLSKSRALCKSWAGSIYVVFREKLPFSDSVQSEWLALQWRLGSSDLWSRPILVIKLQLWVLLTIREHCSYC